MPGKAAVEKVNPNAEALKLVKITIPQDRHEKVPYTTTILSPGFGSKHYVIQRGATVVVPMYVAQAIKEDLKQQEKADILIAQYAAEYENNVKQALG